MERPEEAAPEAHDDKKIDAVLDGLGVKLRTSYTVVAALRREVETRWLDDLRQYKGVYRPDELKTMATHKKSRTFVGMTRTKVRSATARLMDLVFPAGSEDNWSIKPTPVPDMEAPVEAVAALMGRLGRPPTIDEVRRLSVEASEAAAVAMQRQIQDQMIDVQYRKLMKQVIQSGNLYGTGVLKGPLVNRSFRKSWSVDAQGRWALNTQPVTTPYAEFTPVWELYPDAQASSFDEARFVFQRTVMPRHMVLALASRDDFFSDRIYKYLIDTPDGDAPPLFWEQELRTIGWELCNFPPNSKRYEVLEYWGVVDAKTLKDLGLDIDPVAVIEYWANAWILGTTVIKIEIQPIQGVHLPYYAYYWNKDETSIFGEGIPSIIRDDQTALNAVTRATLDNAAICAGPNLEVNVDLLAPGEDPLDFHPFRVWRRSGVGVEAQYQAIRQIDMNSHLGELTALAAGFANNIHEATIPSYMHGEALSKGSVGRTASGLSMLMTAAQITFKDQLFGLDDDVQKPFIESMYHWNMQFNPDPAIKGDFNVVVKGTSSLVAREIRASNLTEFANSTLNQFDAPFIDRLELNKQRVKVLELGDDIVMDAEHAKRKLIRGLADGQFELGDVAVAATPQGIAGQAGAVEGLDAGGFGGGAGAGHDLAGAEGQQGQFFD